MSPPPPRVMYLQFKNMVTEATVKKKHAVKPQQVNVGKHAEEYTTKFHVKKKQKYRPAALPDHATNAESPGENF